MNVQTMIDELRCEREQLDAAILSLERFAAGMGQRRGRPPKWLAEPKPEMSTESQKRRVLSPEARKRISESQRRRWAARRKAES